jgi:hypothetical protein
VNRADGLVRLMAKSDDAARRALARIAPCTRQPAADLGSDADAFHNSEVNCLTVLGRQLVEDGRWISVLMDRRVVERLIPTVSAIISAARGTSLRIRSSITPSSLSPERSRNGSIVD